MEVTVIDVGIIFKADVPFVDVGMVAVALKVSRSILIAERPYVCAGTLSSDIRLNPPVSSLSSDSTSSTCMWQWPLK